MFHGIFKKCSLFFYGVCYNEIEKGDPIFLIKEVNGMKKKLWLLLPAVLVLFIAAMTIRDAAVLRDGEKLNSKDYISYDVYRTLKNTDLRIYGSTEANTDKNIHTYLTGPDKEAAEALLKETYGDLFRFCSFDDKRVAGIYTVYSNGYTQWKKDALLEIEQSLYDSPLSFRFSTTLRENHSQTDPYSLTVRLFAADPDSEQVVALLAEYENVHVYISAHTPTERTITEYSAGYSGKKN